MKTFVQSKALTSQSSDINRLFNVFYNAVRIDGSLADVATKASHLRWTSKDYRDCDLILKRFDNVGQSYIALAHAGKIPSDVKELIESDYIVDSKECMLDWFKSPVLSSTTWR